MSRGNLSTEESLNRAYHPRAKCCWCGKRFYRAKYKGLRTWFCESLECARRQLERALVVVKGKRATCINVPAPIQVVFEEATEQTYMVHLDGMEIETCQNVLFGGAAGGTKSHAIRWLFIRLCLTHDNLNCLLLRRNITELRETHIKRVDHDSHLFGGVLNKSENILKFPNGSSIKFGHLDDPKDVSNFLSTEYDKIGFDEMVTFPLEETLLIMSRARGTREDIKPGIVAGTNPGGREAYWVKRYWIDKDITQKDDPTYTPEGYVYVPAKLDDNPHLGPAYDVTLARLPEELRRAFRDGDWDIFPGQFFQEWRRDKHVVNLDPYNLPEGRWYLSVDWGYMAVGAALFILVTKEGRAYVVKEYMFRLQVASEVAQEIKRIASELNWDHPHGVGDNDMHKPGTDTGESPMETFSRMGVSLVSADKQRENGWQRLRHWLRAAPDGQPWLQINEDGCPYLIRTLPALVMHDKFPEDISDGLEDHGADALRYFSMFRPAPNQDNARRDIPVNSPAWLLKTEKKNRLKGRSYGQVR